MKLINELKLDLACGDAKREGFAGIDIAKTNSTDYVVDLQQFPWPIESESADEINCSHYIEHIPHTNYKAELNNILDKSNSFEEFKENLKNSKPELDGFIKFINEIYRILKPGGTAKLVAPYYSSIRFVGDPTHVRPIGDSTVWYLSKQWIDDNKLTHYGLECNFDIKLSYLITNEMTLRSEEVRNKAIIHDLNVVDDIIIDLTKK